MLCAASNRNVLIDRLERLECFGTEVICFRIPGLSRVIKEIRISKNHQWGSLRLYFQAFLIYHRYCSTTISFTTHVLKTYGSMLPCHCMTIIPYNILTNTKKEPYYINPKIIELAPFRDKLSSSILYFLHFLLIPFILFLFSIFVFLPLFTLFFIYAFLLYLFS